jgi:PEP-CTERM motif
MCDDARTVDSQPNGGRTSMKRLIAAVAALALVAGAAGQARADSIPLYNTGVDAGGTPLADGTIGDPHYSLISVASGSTTEIMVRTSVGGYPIPPWLPDDSLSAWIGPHNDQQLNSPNGTYDYQTTFSLAGLDPTTASIGGNWSTDDPGLDILINGVSTGQTSLNYATWSSFAINSGFVAGVNTLDFIVANTGGGPTGLRVEMSGDARAVPEPGSIALIGLGGVMALGYLRRKGRRVSA